MANLMTAPTNFPRRINMYVPAMAYSSDVNYNGATRVNFGAPPAANATAIVNAQSVSAAGSLDVSSYGDIAAPFGRNLTVVLSGAGTGNVTVQGFDYLGQPVQETFALNGATPVVGKKAFKTPMLVTYPTVGAVTMNIGYGSLLGLPYKAIRVAYEVANGVAAAAGTLTAPSLVDPQTATTADPRGVYATTTALDGTTIISAAFDCVNDVNTANNGGLHGIRQFGG